MRLPDSRLAVAITAARADFHLNAIASANARAKRMQNE